MSGSMPFSRLLTLYIMFFSALAGSLLSSPQNCLISSSEDKSLAWFTIRYWRKDMTFLPAAVFFFPPSPDSLQEKEPSNSKCIVQVSSVERVSSMRVL